MITFIKAHKYLEAAVGFLLFFGGYLFVMIVSSLIGDWLDEQRKNKKENEEEC